MNYVHTVRYPDIPSELINQGSGGHELCEIRAWITPRESERWVEVECLCGGLSRASGPRTYLDLAQEAWTSLCGSRSPLSA